MGTIDSATYTLTCPECGRTESDRVLDKGSGWGGSSWQRPTFELFETQISGSARDEYEVTGTCLVCRVAADTSVRHGS